MYDKKTINFYDKNVAKYSDWSKSNSSFKLESKLLSLIHEANSIIDIGCGAGHSSIWFSEKVGSVTALDPSSKMIKRLKTFPKLKAVADSILSLKMKNEFDGAWASFSLQHLMKEDQKEAYAVIYEMLKEKGIFYLGIHKGKNSYRDNLGRLYVPREKQELSQELEEIGFSIKDISIRKSLSFEKKPIEIMHIFCQKI